MSAHRPPTSGLPTLTEVVEMPWAPAPQRAPQSEATVIAEAADPMLTEPTAALHASTEDQIVQRVLLDLQRQIDLMLDYRLREVLTPVLTRATDALVLEARSALASTLRDIVARSVAQEISRHRGR